MPRPDALLMLAGLTLAATGVALDGWLGAVLSLGGAVLSLGALIALWRRFHA